MYLSSFSSLSPLIFDKKKTLFDQSICCFVELEVFISLISFAHWVSQNEQEKVFDKLSPLIGDKVYNWLSDFIL